MVALGGGGQDRKLGTISSGEEGQGPQIDPAANSSEDVEEARGRRRFAGDGGEG